MAGINNVTLAGRLTKDIELRKTSNGVSFASFTVAVDRDREKDAADFISCTAWRQQADFLSNYALKGTMISVVGHIKTGSYEKDGRKVYTTDVEAEKVSILESKKTRSDYPSGGTSLKTKEADKLTLPAGDEDEYDLPW